jgi:P27 family predicted phage terminase small subunit
MSEVEDEDPYVAPPAPSFLHSTGRRAWDHLCAELEITEADGLALLERYAAAVDREAQSRRQIRDNGCWLEDRFGRKYAHPAVAVERQSRAQATAILARLRQSITAEEKMALAVARENRLRARSAAQARRRDRGRFGA